MRDLDQYAELLARGEQIPSQAFRLLLQDPQALKRLNRLLALRSLIEQPADELVESGPAGGALMDDPVPPVIQERETSSEDWGEMLAKMDQRWLQGWNAEDLIKYLEGTLPPEGERLLEEVLSLVDPEVVKVLPGTCEQETRVAQTTETSPDFTQMLERNQTDRILRILDKYDLLSSLMQEVGLDVAESSSFRFECQDRLQQPAVGRFRFRDALASWLVEFAKARGISLEPAAIVRLWPRLVERCVLLASLRERVDQEPDWVQAFREHALRNQVSTIAELRVLPVPERIAQAPGFMDFKRDLIVQIRHDWENAKNQLGMTNS